MGAEMELQVESRMVKLETHVEVIRADLSHIRTALDGSAQRTDTLRDKFDVAHGDLHKRIDGVGEKVEDTRAQLVDKTENVRAEVVGKIENVRIDVTGKIEGVRTDLTGRIEAVRTDLAGKIDGVLDKLIEQSDGARREIAVVRDELTRRNDETRKELLELRDAISSAKLWGMRLYLAGFAAGILLLVARGFKLL
jgi:chromosome segregation ATPase